MNFHSIALSCLFLTIPGFARGDSIDDLIEQEIMARHIPGLAVAVVQNGKMVKTQGYGYADLNSKKSATSQTVFQLASVTKQFVATGIMSLVEDGKLSTDAPITRFLDNLPTSWNGITIRQLLTHTSGIQDYLGSPAAAKTDLQLDPQLTKLVRSMGLQFQPGDKWEYSNSNYLLLGHVIERVSGKSYDRFLVDRFFRPFGMASTRRRVVGDPAMAVGYVLAADGSTPKEAMFLPPALWDNGDGGLVSTAEDMAKWDIALTSGRVVSKPSIDEMYTRVVLNGGKVQDYGYAMVVHVVGSHRIIGHGGSRPGVAANYTRWLDDGTSIVVLANVKVGGNDPYQIARRIAGLYAAAIP